MNNSRPHPRLRRRRLTTIATFVLAFGLASSGVALAASGYSRLLAASRPLPPNPCRVPDYGLPPGCVFPPAGAFPSQGGLQ